LDAAAYEPRALINMEGSLVEAKSGGIGVSFRGCFGERACVGGVGGGGGSGGGPSDDDIGYAEGRFADGGGGDGGSGGGWRWWRQNVRTAKGETSSRGLTAQL